MNAFRLSMLACLVVGLAGLGGARGADDKKAGDSSNKDKIVGTWEVVKSETGWNAGDTLQFTKDGKTMAKLGGGVLTLDGTYTIDGDKLKQTVGAGKTEVTRTIKTLTDTTLILVDENKKTDEFKKKK